jgi:predicted transcriptional regulator
MQVDANPSQKHEVNLVAIRAKIAVGLDQAKRGELFEGEIALAEIFGNSDT